MDREDGDIHVRPFGTGAVHAPSRLRLRLSPLLLTSLLETRRWVDACNRWPHRLVLDLSHSFGDSAVGPLLAIVVVVPSDWSGTSRTGRGALVGSDGSTVRLPFC